MCASKWGDICRLAQNTARNCGYAVFPCTEDKRPTLTGWQQRASTDADAIAELWRERPGPLIGIVTGKRSGVDVLDVDAKHPIALDWWAAASQRMSPTRLYRTRSGGLHGYLLHADGVTNTASKLARGVDTRGDGGYAIFWFAAGFECLDHSPPTPWPAWLLECVRWKPHLQLPRTRAKPANPDNALGGIADAIARAAEGERNRVLFWGACRFREHMWAGLIGRHDAEATLITAALSTGLHETEARRTIASAWRAV
jgi:hypothetical protein